MTTQTSLRIRQFDENHYEELLAVRVELLPRFNTDGTPSLDGKVIFHTEWWYFGFGELRGKRQGERIEHEFNEVLGRTWMVQTPDGPIEIPTMFIIGGTKEAFNVLADEYLATPPVPGVPMPLMPAETPTPLSEMLAPTQEATEVTNTKPDDPF